MVKETTMKKEIISLSCVKMSQEEGSVLDKPQNKYHVWEEDENLSTKEIIVTTDFNYALKCFLNRT
jgi:hypothetical protein